MLGTTTPPPPNPANIQGLILRGYTHPYSCHLMFKFQSSSVALNTKAFFAALYPKVQPGTNWGTNKPVSMLNIGISFNGLQILGVANTKNSTFPFEFQQGPWSQGSQQSLGDFNESSPLNWWYNNFQNTDVHCVVHTYGLTQTALDQMVTFVTSSATANGLTELLPLNSGDGRLYQSLVEGDSAKIHFGYTDGISEPALTTPTSASTENQADLDNFLIGYPKLSIIDPAPSGNTSKNPEAAFAMDGCYNAFRILYQNVAAFNNFLIAQATDPTNVAKLAFLGLSQDELVEWFAAKLVGRWRNGSPLMLSPLAPDPATADAENFVYSDPTVPSPNQDVPSASKCPFSAHTRVANPRDQMLSPSQGEGSNGPPRILRRGMPYGAELVGNTNDNVDRGLIGLFLCGSIAQQFEKLYGWMNFNNFSPTPDYSVTHPPQDALLGNRPTAPNLGEYPGVASTFTIPIQVTPTQSDEIVISNLPIFIQTRGTAYCLLPSLNALNSLATGVML
jgi:deferrochelatase/peroxidase EfeB